jgi:hypothetical protein
VAERFCIGSNALGDGSKRGDLAVGFLGCFCARTKVTSRPRAKVGHFIEQDCTLFVLKFAFLGQIPDSFSHCWHIFVFYLRSNGWLCTAAWEAG